MSQVFTGIIECVGRITDTREVMGGKRLRIDAGSVASECALGDSICASGVCLTVARINGDSLEFDVIVETLQQSTLGSRQVGDLVNLERSLRVGDRVDGHFVQGHVDGTATVERVLTSSRECVVWLRPQAHLLPFVVPKGSVAIDGVSLTIAEVRDNAFSIALIPTTLQRTTLSSLVAGQSVNIESDIVTRTIVHRLSEVSLAGGLSLQILREAGFA